MMDVRLAVRNLLRNRRRSIATFSALAIGTIAILLFGGYRANIEFSMLTAYVREAGHLQIQHRDYFLHGSGNPSRFALEGYEDIIRAIRDDPELANLTRVATPMLQFGGVASNDLADSSRAVLGVGMRGADQARLRSWNEFGVAESSQRRTLEGSPADSAIIGTGVARVLQLCKPLGLPDCPAPATEARSGEATQRMPDDIAALVAGASKPADVQGQNPPRVDLLANTAGGAPNVVSLRVEHAERQGFKEVDEVYVLLHLEQAQRLVYGRRDPRVTAIVLQLERTALIGQAQERLQALLKTHPRGASAVVMDFKALNPFFVQTIQMFDMIFGFIFVLIGSIVLFAVGNTVSSSVTERTIEVGTVRALGLRQGGVQRLFLIEGLILGISGTVAGVLFALFISAGVNALDLTWLPPGSAHPLPLQIMLTSKANLIVGTALLLILISTASAWWPARKASRLVIVDALRHV